MYRLFKFLEDTVNQTWVSFKKGLSTSTTWNLSTSNTCTWITGCLEVCKLDLGFMIRQPRKHIKRAPMTSNYFWCKVLERIMEPYGLLNFHLTDNSWLQEDKMQSWRFGKWIGCRHRQKWIQMTLESSQNKCLRSTKSLIACRSESTESMSMTSLTLLGAATLISLHSNC